MKTQSKASVKEIEIPIYFHNYKLLKDKEFILKGSYIYFIQGPNQVGKTSFLKALTSLQVANDDTALKVSKGENNGYYEATIPAADGTMITIRHEFTNNNKGKFIAIKENGTKVGAVKEIRNLFGYTPINVSDFFALSNSAEGRRKQRDVILKLLPENKRDEFNELDQQEIYYYSERTEINKTVEIYNNKLIELSPKEKDLLPKEKEAQDLLDQYNSITDKRTQLDKYEISLNQTKDDIEIAEDTLKTLKEKKSEIEENLEKTEKFLAEFKDLTSELLISKITSGQELLKTIKTAKTKLDINNESHPIIKSKTAESEELTKTIERCRDEKNKIVSESELPVENISFEDSYLKIDGYVFKENQICESDAILILANILAKINPSPIQIIGDASILDSSKLDQLNDIAEKNNKIMFVDEVIRDADNMVVTGYEEIITDELKTKIKKIANEKNETEKETKSIKETNVSEKLKTDTTEKKKPLF